jgi:hypothetical protein
MHKRCKLPVLAKRFSKTVRNIFISVFNDLKGLSHEILVYFFISLDERYDVRNRTGLGLFFSALVFS